MEAEKAVEEEAKGKPEEEGTDPERETETEMMTKKSGRDMEMS